PLEHRIVSCSGSGNGCSPKFTAQPNPGSLVNTRTLSGEASHRREPSPSAGCDRRIRSAVRYSDNTESGSSLCAATVSERHVSGTGSQEPPGPNSNGGCWPPHGIGTRQPS